MREQGFDGVFFRHSHMHLFAKPSETTSTSCIVESANGASLRISNANRPLCDISDEQTFFSVLDRLIGESESASRQRMARKQSCFIKKILD